MFIVIIISIISNWHFYVIFLHLMITFLAKLSHHTKILHYTQFQKFFLFFSPLIIIIFEFYIYPLISRFRSADKPDSFLQKKASKFYLIICLFCIFYRCSIFLFHSLFCNWAVFSVTAFSFSYFHITLFSFLSALQFFPDGTAFFTV